MKALHPEDGGLHEPYHRGMFPSADHKLTTILQSDEFQQLLKTNATTSEGQDQVAQYFGVYRKPPRKVLYKRTFGAPDQGQMLDV